MKKKLVYLLFLPLFLNMECRCDEETLIEGLETRVYGKVYDTLNNSPVANQKLFIGEYEDYYTVGGGLQVSLVQYLDSIYTDKNGDYEIAFTTSGQGSIYKIITEQTHLSWTYNIKPVRIEKIESDNEINFSFVNLYPCYLNITLNNIDYLPLEIYTSVGFPNSGFNKRVNDLEVINISNSNITRKVYLNRKSYNYIKFKRIVNDTITQSVTYSVPPFQELSSEFDINLTNDDFK